MTVSELLNAPEGEHYEFKEAKKRYDFEEAVQYCCAMANCGGGKFVLGITDKRPRKVVGSEAFSQPERTCKGLIDRLHIRIDFNLYDHEGFRILVFNVASRPIGLPVQADGIAWWRDGDSLIPMPEEIRRAIYEEIGHDFSGDICTNATIDDLDVAAINYFRGKWAKKSGNTRIRQLTVEQILIDCGAISDKGTTYAALILFGSDKANKQHLPQAEVVYEYCAKNTAGPAQQRDEFCAG